MSGTETETGQAVVIIDGLPWRPALADELAAGGCRVRELGLGQWRRDTIAAAIRQDAEGCALVGLSIGASLAAWHAAQEPERVKALVLISPVAIMPTNRRAPTALFAHPDAAAVIPEDGHQDLLLMNLGAIDDGYLQRHLERIQCPTLVVFGQQDRLLHPEAPAIYKERVPNCHIAYVYDAGHAVALERPQALLELVSDFLRRRETFVVANHSGVINP